MKVAVLNKIVLALCFVGVFVSGALSFAHHSGSGLQCGKTSGCKDVAAYVASNWGNFPVADVGLAAYVVLAILAVYRSIFGFKPAQMMPTVIIGGLGALISVALTAYAFVGIGATCPYCVGSAVTMILIFLVSLVAMKGEGEAAPPDQPLATWGLTAFLVLSSLGAISASTAEQPLPNVPTTIEGLIPPKPHSLGDENAEVVVVEFYDLFCQYCRTNFTETKAMVSRSNGRLRVVFRHFPLEMLENHQYTEIAMNMSEIAAEQGKYFQFVEKLFALDRTTTTPDDMLGIMRSLGFKEDELRKRIGNEQDAAFLRFYADKELANKMALDTTPTYFIARKGLAPGVYTNKNFRQALAKLGIE